MTASRLKLESRLSAEPLRQNERVESGTLQHETTPSKLSCQPLLWEQQMAFPCKRRLRIPTMTEMKLKPVIETARDR